MPLRASFFGKNRSRPSSPDNIKHTHHRSAFDPFQDQRRHALKASKKKSSVKVVDSFSMCAGAVSEARRTVAINVVNKPARNSDDKHNAVTGKQKKAAKLIGGRNVGEE
ncbi:conserved hypothetical protein [delta proteobacterium NaphS2]|nr:conserved hypothetical protein [delta proteobacterium NaphS2]EFK06240.1 conserved hypothetical protein [delta proteobacterium NaphS2]EFK06428.1 conserved hypothetical protein [delta proteobacterium NaphS2]EFK06901.1 conserved hypothetical protein [delta proteobacterium NaphS2]EFK06956.1 conserved hypothetical protein [delta proteobacterium NaphS2]